MAARKQWNASVAVAGAALRSSLGASLGILDEIDQIGGTVGRSLLPAVQRRWSAVRPIAKLFLDGGKSSASSFADSGPRDEPADLDEAE